MLKASPHSYYVQVQFYNFSTIIFYIYLTLIPALKLSSTTIIQVLIRHLSLQATIQFNKIIKEEKMAE